MDKPGPSPLRFEYRFHLPDGVIKTFEVRLDGETLALQHKPRASYPHWAKLEFGQCPGCPLRPEKHPNCPIAMSLVDVLEFFKDSLSSDELLVEIVTDARTYSKRTSLSNGISGIVGLQMATSGCPLFNKLKPMALTHLPFANLRETMYRYLAMYMLAQHFLAKKRKPTDIGMEKFTEMLEGLRAANRAFVKRLYEVCRKDASLNAIVHLDCFADNTAFSLKTLGLDGVERLFDGYFD